MAKQSNYATERNAPAAGLRLAACPDAEPLDGWSLPMT